MSGVEDSNLVKARSSIVWMLAIVVAFAAVFWIEKESGKPLIAPPAAGERAAVGTPAPALARSADLPADAAPRALTADEQRYARIAWAYFERNTDPTTGLVASVEGFPSATMWDIGSSLLATIAAHDLGIIDRAAFDDRMGRALGSLAKLPLYAGELPNKSYDVASLSMNDAANKPSATGVGWSAIDAGRLLVPLNIVAWKHPQHTAQARAAIARWNTDRLSKDGRLIGMHTVGEGQPPQALQEGRLGYEQYAARTLYLMGVDVENALDWRPFMRLVDVDGVQVPVDTRDPAKFGAQNPVVSEPFVLTGLEMGFTASAREAAWRVYRAQEAHWKKTGTLTAVSEDNIDRAPWFVYNSVHTAGRNWAAATEKGEDASAARTLSTKAAFGWHALYGNEYTRRLVAGVSALNDPARGWYAGLYEDGAQPNKALTANTNAVVLESLAYIAHGPLMGLRQR